MVNLNVTTRDTKWYHCPQCWNYSIQPMECCGEFMVEEYEDEEIMYDLDPVSYN